MCYTTHERLSLDEGENLKCYKNKIIFFQYMKRKENIILSL